MSRKQMTAQESLAAAQEYYRLMRAGVPHDEAYKRAYPNGIPSLKDRQKEAGKEEQKAAIAQVAGQVGGTAAGVYGTGKLIEALKGTKEAAEVAKETATQATNAAQATQTAANSAASAGSSGASAFPVGTAADGSTMMSDGSTVAAGQNVMTAPLETLGGYSPAQALGAAQAAYGGYQTVDSFGKGGEGIRSGATNLGAGIGSIFLPGIGTVAGAAAGNAVGYGLQDNKAKNNLMLMGMGGLAGGPALMLARDKLMHKSVAQRQQSRTEGLANMGRDNEAWQNYIGVMRSVPKPEKGAPSFAGKYRTWEEYQQAGLDAKDLSGVYGNLKTFGPEWAALTQEQREAITQAGINAGLYDAKQGDVMVTDPDKLRELAAPIIGGAQPQTAAPQPAAPSPLLDSLNQSGIRQLPGQIAPDQMAALQDKYGPMQDLALRYSPEQSAQIKQNWPQMMEGGLAAALTPMMKQQPDAGTLRRWRLGYNG